MYDGAWEGGEPREWRDVRSVVVAGGDHYGVIVGGCGGARGGERPSWRRGRWDDGEYLGIEVDGGVEVGGVGAEVGEDLGVVGE